MIGIVIKTKTTDLIRIYTGSVALISFERSSATLRQPMNKIVLQQTDFPAISDHQTLLDHVHQFDSTQSAAG